MLNKDIKTLLRIHKLSIKILRLLKKFTGKTKQEVIKEGEKWTKFQEDYVRTIKDHNLTIEEEMFWALSVLNASVYYLFDIEAEYDPRVKKYGTKKFGETGKL